MVDTNWSLAPIKDIVLVYVNTTQNSNEIDTSTIYNLCPAGYEYSTSTKFQGLYDGCNCKNQVYNIFDEIRIG
jgi:hypothetical protein